MKENPIYKAEFEKVFRYDFDTDIVERNWRGIRWEVVNVKPKPSGYSDVCFKGRNIKLHRLIWTLANGDIPKGMEVDHIDGKPENNKLINLQLLSHRENVNKSRSEINPHFHKRDGVYQVQAAVKFEGKRRSFQFQSFKEKSDAQKMCDEYNGLFTYGKRFYNARLDTHEYWKYCMEEFKLQYCLKTGLPARMNQAL